MQGLTPESTTAINVRIMFRHIFMGAALSAASVAQVWACSVQEVSAELCVGDTQVLELSGNPTTGYTWMLAEPLPTGCPVSVEIDYTTTPTKRPISGSGGIFKVKYTGITPGSATVALIYARPWARDTTQSQKIHLTITVK